MEKETREQTFYRFMDMFLNSEHWKPEYGPYSNQMFNLFCGLCKGKMDIHPRQFTKKHFDEFINFEGLTVDQWYKALARRAEEVAELTPSQQADVEFEQEYWDFLEGQDFQYYKSNVRTFIIGMGITQDERLISEIWGKLLKHQKQLQTAKKDNVSLWGWLMDNYEVSPHAQLVWTEAKRIGAGVNDLSCRYNQEFLQEMAFVGAEAAEGKEDGLVQLNDEISEIIEVRQKWWPAFRKFVEIQRKNGFYSSNDQAETDFRLILEKLENDGHPESYVEDPRNWDDDEVMVVLTMMYSDGVPKIHEVSEDFKAIEEWYDFMGTIAIHEIQGRFLKVFRVLDTGLSEGEAKQHFQRWLKWTKTEINITPDFLSLMDWVVRNCDIPEVSKKQALTFVSKVYAEDGEPLEHLEDLEAIQMLYQYDTIIDQIEV